MRSHLAIIAVTVSLSAALAPRHARAQDKDRLVLALYAPSIAFRDTDARLTYLRLLADAVASNIGRAVEPRLYGSLAQLRKANPDFAIVEPQCATGGSAWRPIATAKIGDKQVRRWALYGPSGESVASLRGKRLAYAASGCADKELIENALFGSEVRLRYFSGTSPKTTINGAVAEVSTVRAAQAVFAPEQEGGSLTKLFDAGEVSNPVMVAINKRLSAKLIDDVQQAALRFGSSGAIDGWGPVDRPALADLSRRMQGVQKRFVFADPPPGKLPIKSIVPEPKSATATIPVRRYFEVDARP